MRRILFVTNQLGGGGAERVLSLLANYFAEKYDMQVFILAIRETKNKYEISPKVIVDECDGKDWNSLRIIRAIRREIRKVKPNTIISFEYHINMKTIIAAMGLKDKKVIVSERNDPSNRGGKIGYKQVRNVLYKFADVLVCQTFDAKMYFPKSIQNITEIIPNPLKLDLPNPWNGKRKKYIVNFCRLNPQKNLRLLIDAFAIFVKKYPEFELKIYGDGELKEDILKYIYEMDLVDCIHLLPATNDIHDRVKDAYMFVSSSDFEGLSNSMLEAMAIGIPTICTDCSGGGARMMIENEINGLLVPVKDKLSLANAMGRYVEDDNLAVKCSINAMKIREELSLERICFRWKQLL